MNIIKTVTISLIILVSSSVLIAQESKREGRMDMLKKELNLEENQVSEIQLVFKEAKKEKKVIHGNTSISKEEKSERLKVVKKKTEQRMSKILTTEQLAKYETMKSEKKEEKKEDRKEGKEAKGQQMAEELGLDEKQQSELKTIKEKSRAEAKAIKDDSSLSEEERRAALKQNRVDADEKVKELLTDEQYEKMKAMKKERRHEKKGKPHMKK